MTFEKMAKGLPAAQFFEWWTDFSSEDPEILGKRGVKGFVSRRVTREGNNIHVETEMLAMVKPISFLMDVVIHPESLTFETKGRTPGVAEETTVWTFTDVPSMGTKISAEQSYTLLKRYLKVLDALGLVKVMGKRTLGKHADAFIAEAQEKLASSSTVKG